MNMLIHNLKVAIRNLMNYKIQTLMSVASIAIGIVTLSLTHSILNNFRLPPICDEPYFDRAYEVSLSIYNPHYNNTFEYKIDNQLLRALKENGGLKHAEKIVVPNGLQLGVVGEIVLSDSSVYNGQYGAIAIDPEYPDYSGIRSAVTGEKIRKLKAGEAIISQTFAKRLFNDKNPIGAVLNSPANSITNGHSATIVDVYEQVPLSEYYLNNNCIFYAIGDNIEDEDMSDIYSTRLYIVLREGSSESQLIEEINERVKPLDIIGTELRNVAVELEINTLIGIRLLVYLIGSLILLAAIIGFLRIQTQLFWIRKREISLRIVNGATKTGLFTLLITEISITICLSMILALWLGMLLEGFIAEKLSSIIEHLYVDQLWSCTLVIGAALLVICSVIAWITLLRICRSGQGLAANMRRSRNHLFRNVMLGVQTTICLLFICVTFILIKGVDQMLDYFNLPPNDSLYKECILLRPVHSKQPEQLLEEIKRLPDLDRMVMWDRGYYAVEEIRQNPEISEKINDRSNYESCLTTDTATLSLLGVEVEWFDNNVDRSRSILLSEGLYKLFSEVGVLDKNALTIYGGIANHTLPIAGIIRNIPYNTEFSTRSKNYAGSVGHGSIIAINPDWISERNDHILIPKPGAGKALVNSVNETIHRLEPFSINNMVLNYRENLSPQSIIVESFRSGGVILGIVSLIICAMSIYSTIALDTRARRKEVAIRKVNGAKSKNIYNMFGKVYVVILVIAALIATPIAVIFSDSVLKTLISDYGPADDFSPAGAIILGVLVVVMLVSLIVGWQTHRVMRIDSSKIIAKE
ncbi:MAG: FtsX-like permease family protein [Paramuribaculum sp.]|nr:FtsX-like permease family protein [Paramuribaculum sp.]